MELKRVIICGGDMRSVYMAKFFLEKGINTGICGFDSALLQKYSLRKCGISEMRNADAVIFGLPAVKNDMTVNCPLCDEIFSFENILSVVNKNCLIAGGRFSQEALNLARERGSRIFDYSTDEVFQIENAFYTAEGAVEEIIKNTIKSISELKILIVGYGRISKALCKMFSAFNSEITVYARRLESRAWASMLGCKEISELNGLKKYDLIVNTVPYEILCEKELDMIREDALIVDLSARPGYVSKEECEKRKIKLLFLPGIPATSAPKSAGEAAARAVMRICSEI